MAGRDDFSAMLHVVGTVCRIIILFMFLKEDLRVKNVHNVF